MANVQHDPLLLDSVLCSMDKVQHETVTVIERTSSIGPRSRAFFQVPHKSKDLASCAAQDVRHYTFFENLMLNAEDITLLLAEFCTDAEKE